ncbi:hypothetical protein NDU88_007682 [Pleurodeles waltl]|uniref:Secreted protein n=1 Tax=Pleurodeles waltl TaxID=8319 RepID=A0AAV7ST07_PLEWA|nr:hypothetical protein NDU88_007682 [Pleurodeles waltl]
MVERAVFPLCLVVLVQSYGSGSEGAISAPLVGRGRPSGFAAVVGGGGCLSREEGSKRCGGSSSCMLASALRVSPVERGEFFVEGEGKGARRAGSWAGCREASAAASGADKKAGGVAGEK